MKTNQGRARCNGACSAGERYRLGVAAALAQRSARPTFRHLWDAEFRVYSQWGEDGILEYLCECLDLTRPRAVELGAGDFTECNTRFLAERRHASVVAVDARDDLVDHVRSQDLSWRTSVFPVRGWITPTTAPRILADARELMGGVDLVSLDIDGNDYWVADSLDLRGVRVVVVEFNAVLGGRRPVTVPRDDHFDRTLASESWLYYGASLRAWLHLFDSRGFAFLGTNRACTNAFFCARDVLPAVPLTPPPVDDLTQYVDCRVRESRGPDGRLSYLGGRQRAEAIADLAVVDVVTGERLSVADAHEWK